MKHLTKYTLSILFSISIISCGKLNPDSGGAPGVMTKSNVACVQQNLKSEPNVIITLPNEIRNFENVCNNIGYTDARLSLATGETQYECKISAMHDSASVNEIRNKLAALLGSAKANEIISDGDIRSTSSLSTWGKSIFLSKRNNSSSVDVIWTLTRLFEFLPKTTGNLEEIIHRLSLQRVGYDACGENAYYEINNKNIAIYDIRRCSQDTGEVMSHDVFFSADGKIVLEEVGPLEQKESCPIE